MTRAYSAVVFDFDFTLVDSSAGVIECVSFAFQEMGLPRPLPESIKATIGRSLADTFRTLAGEDLVSQAARFRELFVHRADQVMADLTRVYPTVPTVAQALRDAGIKLAIVSTKFRYRIEGILAREQLRQYFDFVIGGEDVAIEKPDPTGLLKAVADLGLPRQDVVYVGDSVVDGETAERAGVDFIGVLTGVTSAPAFEPWQPVATIPDLGHLPALLAVV